MKNPFYTETVTVFNQATGDVLEDDKWYCTVLHNVRLRETKGANITASGLADADSARLHIATPVPDKPYLDPIAWSELLDKSEAFTLCQDRDFFVVGDHSDVDCTETNLYARMKSEYDGVYRVTNVDKYTTFLPHLEVGGK